MSRPPAAPGDRVLAVLRLAVDVRPEEVRALLWAFAYFFCLLCSYYILRPLRDEMGIASGVENLQWLFTGTFVAMLLAVPLFGWTVARFPKRRLVPLVYRFFIVNILIFFVLLQVDELRVPVARAFFIWVSLFNLFVVSVFWSFMADLFRSAQGRRLFAFIAAGGSAGALLGPSITAVLAVPLGPVNLLLVSAVFLELAVWCIGRILKAPEVADTAPVPEDDAARSTGPAIGGHALAGLGLIARSPYLIGICVYILLFTTTSTFLYFQQAHIVAAAFDDPAERTRLFAVIDLSVGLLTILLQLCIAGRLLTRFGVGFGLSMLPLVTLVGFAALAFAPTLVVLVGFQSVRRAANFAIAKPAREILFTVIGVEAKYKAKNVLDTVVYRGGDMASGWAFAGLRGVGLDLPAIATLTVPLAGLWIWLAWRLGRRQAAMAQDPQTGAAVAAQGER